MKLPRAIAAAFVTLLATAATAADRDSRPNIVFMLSDDQGWNGLSVAMHPEIAASRGEIFQTPNLEKLAAEGMRFSNAYAPAPVCSPTRISLQTGKSPARLHWTKAAPPESGHPLLEPQLVKQIADDEVTIGEVLRKTGYATAHYGKWHIAGGGAGARAATATTTTTATPATSRPISSPTRIPWTSSGWRIAQRPSWRRTRRPAGRSSSNSRGTRSTPRKTP
jgi:arylsulfatase A-like enzyme